MILRIEPFQGGSVEKGWMCRLPQYHHPQSSHPWQELHQPKVIRSSKRCSAKFAVGGQPPTEINWLRKGEAQIDQPEQCVA